jgi:hypothetical protein
MKTLGTAVKFVVSRQSTVVSLFCQPLGLGIRNFLLVLRVSIEIIRIQVGGFENLT